MKGFIPEIPVVLKLKGIARQTLMRHELSRAIKAIISLKPGEIPSRSLLLELSKGWGNDGYTANLDYVEEVSRRAAATNGPILECGSGLTTILLGLLAGRRGIETWSLEHSPEWQQQIVATLERHHVPKVQVCICELSDYGGFHWYSPPLSSMPPAFALVVCDGPPDSTPGGRYGLLPVLGDRISRGTLILLDDANRPGESSALSRWKRENGMSIQLCKKPSGTFALVSSPELHPGQ